MKNRPYGRKALSCGVCLLLLALFVCGSAAPGAGKNRGVERAVVEQLAYSNYNRLKGTGMHQEGAASALRGAVSGR